jgi:hypothetical protein
MAPAAPTPAPVPTAAPAPTAAPVPTASPEPAPAVAPEPPAIKEVPTTAVVTFKSNIYAELSINGKRHPASLPAAVRVTLKPGRYVAAFDAPGFMKVQEQFEIPSANPAPLTITGKFPPRAILSLTVRPMGAEVRIDGVLVGSSSGAPIKKTLRAGAHEISVSLAGRRTELRSVDLKEDEVYVLPPIELKKE